MARKSAWDKVLPWGERFRPGLGDWFCTLLMVENNKSYFINEPLACYRIHTTNMHRAMIKNRSAEANTLWILEFFKQRAGDIGKHKWQDIFFEQNRQLGFAYFYHNMEKDAFRCLGRAISYKPSSLFSPSFIRIWFASFIGKKRYEKLKSFSFSK